MSFVIGNTRLSSKGYNFFHALYFKDQVTLGSTFDVPAVRELLTAEFIKPINLDVGTKIEYSGKGEVLAYLFYLGGELRAKNLTKLCNWKDNEVLVKLLNSKVDPKTANELREYTEFLWWLNKIRNAIESESLTLPAVVEHLGLPLKVFEEKPLKLIFTGYARQLTL